MLKLSDIDLFELTPVTKIGDYNFKRNDLFTPFGNGRANGDKLRQALFIIKDLINKGAKGIVTAGTQSSPQPIIVGIICNHFNIPYTIFFGGTTADSLKTKKNFKILSKYNPTIKLVKCARSNAIYSEVNKYAKQNNYGVVKYGMEYSDNSIFDLGANQVKNFPDNSNIVITCGSGNTAKGIFLGLKKTQKNYKRIIVISVAPDRRTTINDFLKQINFNVNYEYISLFERDGFNYDKQLKIKYNNLYLHPNYEAKAFCEFRSKFKELDNVLFYINGGIIYA